MGMFSESEIDNDLAEVDKRVCEYYSLTNEPTSTEKE